MAGNPTLEPLVSNIQDAATEYEKDRANGFSKLSEAIEALRRAVEPPHIYIMKQRFHVRQFCF